MTMYIAVKVPMKKITQYQTNKTRLLFHNKVIVTAAAVAGVDMISEIHIW